MIEDQTCPRLVIGLLLTFAVRERRLRSCCSMLLTGRCLVYGVPSAHTCIGMSSGYTIGGSGRVLLYSSSHLA